MSILHGGGDLTPEDMQEHARLCEIRDKAIKWLSLHQPEIDALSGRESASKEKASVQMALVAEIGAAMYGGIRKEHGPKCAGDVLRDTIGLIGGVLRRNGEDVRMVFKLDFQTLSASPEGPDVAPALAPPEECKCEVDEDGHCDRCRGMLERYMSAMSQSIVIIKEARIEGTMACRPCLRKEMDPVMAMFVKKDLSLMEPENAEAVLKSMFAASQGLQAMQMPLTTRAWDEVIKSRDTQP